MMVMFGVVGGMVTVVDSGNVVDVSIVRLVFHPPKVLAQESWIKMIEATVTGGRSAGLLTCGRHNCWEHDGEWNPRNEQGAWHFNVFLILNRTAALHLLIFDRNSYLGLILIRKWVENTLEVERRIKLASCVSELESRFRLNSSKYALCSAPPQRNSWNAIHLFFLLQPASNFHRDLNCCRLLN